MYVLYMWELCLNSLCHNSHVGFFFFSQWHLLKQIIMGFFMQPVCYFSRHSAAVMQYAWGQYSGATLSFTKHLSCLILNSCLKGNCSIFVYVTVWIVSTTQYCNKKLLLLLTAFNLLPKNSHYFLMKLTWNLQESEKRTLSIRVCSLSTVFWPGWLLEFIVYSGAVHGMYWCEHLSFCGQDPFLV